MPHPTLDGARLLIVEDDAIILMEMEAILGDAGAQIAGSCCSVSAALEWLDETTPAAALLDFRLGQETIMPVARRLGDMGVPFALYTGEVGADLVRQEWPACRIIAKPSPARVIVSAVAELLKCHEPALKVDGVRDWLAA